MNAKDRRASIREVERAAEKLVHKGWRIESLTHTDEADEPFRTTIRIAKDGATAGDVPL